jgi:hypothetical protein
MTKRLANRRSKSTRSRKLPRNVRKQQEKLKRKRKKRKYTDDFKKR